MASKKTATKVHTVTVLNVYKFKQIARICFEVLASNETDKYTTCFNGDSEHGTCTCDGFEKYHLVCYHIKNLRPRAQAYFDSRLAVVEASTSIAILTPEGIAVIDKSELTEHDILADEAEEDAPDMRALNCSFKLAIQPAQKEDWKETAPLNKQDYRLAPAGQAGSRRVPMR